MAGAPWAVDPGNWIWHWARIATFLDGGSVGRLAVVDCSDAIHIGTVWEVKKAQDAGKAVCQHHYKTWVAIKVLLLCQSRAWFL